MDAARCRVRASRPKARDENSYHREHREHGENSSKFRKNILCVLRILRGEIFWLDAAFVISPLRYQRELLDVRGPNDPEMTTIGRGDGGERQPFSHRHNGRIGKSKLRVLRHQLVCATEIGCF